MSRVDSSRVVRAPRGSVLTARSWQTEAPLRMLMNNLDPEVAERPSELVVYGGIGRAARDWESFDRIVATLKRLEGDQTLLIQSGKPVGVFRTHANAPRVLLANSNLVPHWANWKHFNELDRKGLMMYGQMTAGSWIYIGSQGIVQGTYETFVEMGRRHFGGNLKGKWILTAGLGGMGGAQTLAATMAGASCLAIECRQSSIDFRLRTGYVDVCAGNLDEALAILASAKAEGKALSVALRGNAADVLPELVRRGVRPDAVTDQTSAHDPVNGYLPIGWTVERWEAEKISNPDGVAEAAKQSMAVHVRAMLEFHRLGIPTFDYGNNIRQVAFDQGVTDAFAFPGFVPAYIRPLFCRGIGPFRWAALSGDPEDIRKTDAKVKELMPEDKPLHNWLDMASKRIKFQGLPARICWVGLGDRHRLGLAFNAMVASGELKGTRGHWPRSSRLRVRCFPQSRDRSHAGRLRRGFGLAAAERAAQYRVRRNVGLVPSWRRSRHGLLSACRHGRRLRWHAGRRRKNRPCFVERPGNGRHAPRRRGLSAGDRARSQDEPGSAEHLMRCGLSA